ncbi:trypsin-like serine protease, partial [Cellulomonas humilata]
MHKNWTVRVGVTALVLAGLGVPAAYAVQGTAPVGAVAAAVVQLDIGRAGACSGSLISPSWVITAKSCFTETQSDPVVQGAPENPTTATIGRIDLTGSAGHTVRIDRLVPHPDRDV